MSGEAHKQSQRERLLEAMLALAATTGYRSVSVAQLSSHAGVSSATFYEQFSDKEDCMVAAYRAAVARFLAPVQSLVMAGEQPEAVLAGVERLLRAVQQDPHAARVLFIEALGGGPRLRDERLRIAGELGREIDGFLASSTPGRGVLDLPATALAGGIRNIVARYLHIDAEDRLPPLAGELAEWVSSYAAPPGVERWSTGPEALLPSGAPDTLVPAPGAPARMPPRLPRGRHGLPAAVVARSQRTRIIAGTAEVMMSKGYAQATVADIVAAAGIARDVFYAHFSDKHHAFLEAQQHPTQYVLDACAAAYFTAETWPERVWCYLQALLELIAENRAISHLRLVECYAAGPDAIRRAEEITRAFTIFVEEGYGFRPQAKRRPRLCSQAITGAVYEIIQRNVERGEFSALTRQLPRLTYIVIAPFAGAAPAVELVRDIRSRQAPAGRQ